MGTLAYSGILWHTLAYPGILWHTLAYPGKLLPKGGWAGGSPDGWLGGWLVGWLVTNFPDRVCDNKVSCKKPAHLDQKWPRNGCFKFSRLFWGGGGPPSQFLATRWGRGGLETSKMDLLCPKTPILTHHTSLNSFLGRNGEKFGFFKNRAIFDQKSGQNHP